MEDCAGALDYVAPHAGAWIETRHGARGAEVGGSHPTRVRGLKHEVDLALARHFGRSHPTRVRGLKQVRAWAQKRAWCASHPTRVRGLKLRHIAGNILDGTDRTPHRCVIEMGRLERSCKPACHDAPLRIHDLKLPAKKYPKAGLNKKALTEFSVRAFCFFLELVKGLEPITCRLQISCSTD